MAAQQKMSEQPNMSDKETAELKQAFSTFDVNGDGSISTAELITVMRGLGMNPTKEYVDEIVKEVDTDGSGQITFKEFSTLMGNRRKNVDEREELMEAFKTLDKDKNGYLDYDELKFIMGGMGDKMPDEEVAELMRIADTNGDGRIDFDEFVAMMTS